MLSKRLLAILSVFVIMSLAILACGGGGSPTEAPEATNTPRVSATEEDEPTEEAEPTEEVEEPTEEAEPTEEGAEPTEEGGQGIVAGEVQVTTLYGYVDEYDYFHVVGLVYNDTEDPATSIELTLQLTDGNGDSVLTDSDDEPLDEVTFSPFLYTIAQGETSPFDYYVSVEDADATADWEGTVTVTDYSDGDVNRGEVEVINDNITVDQYGTIYLTGELVNNTDEPVLVNSLAGALLAADGTALAADASYTVARYLAPNGDEGGNDRTPFSISLDGPADDANSSVFYFDVDRTDEATVAQAINVDIANAYIDDFDSLHIVANVTNNGEETLTVSLVAGLYNVDGGVMDAATASAPIYITPGATVPVSFDYFSTVNGDTELIDQVDSYSVQVDGYWTYETSFDSVEIETANDTFESQDGYITFTGDVVNSSEAAISSASLIVAIYDAEGTLFASGWTSAYPEGDSIAAGESVPYTLTLYVPADLDTSNFTFVTFAQGYPE